MGISVSSPNIRKFKRYSLGKFQTDIQVSNVENLEDFFDYNSVYNTFEEKIHEVGAHVSSISKSIFSDETEGSISNDFTSVVNKIVSTAGSLSSTGVVISSSVVSGGAKLLEHLSDGLTWTAGKIVDGFFNVAAFGAGFFSKDAKESILETKNDFDSGVREHIARDQVGEFNQAFYENTKLGRFINKNSYIKYDSDVAKTIQNVTTTTVEIGLATAATVLTGGMAAPISAAAVASIGFIDAAGASAEKHYSAPEVSDNAEADILLDGVVGSLEWYSFGKFGANAVGAAHAINQAGVEGVKTTVKATSKAISSELQKNGVLGSFKRGFRNTVSKKNFLSALKVTMADVDTYTDVSGVIASDLKRYYDGEDVDLVNTTLKLGSSLFANIGFNTVTHGLVSPTFELKNDQASVNELYNFYASFGSSATESYGVDQDVIQKMCNYKLNTYGYITNYDYSSATNVVNRHKEQGLPIPHFRKEGNQKYVSLKDKLQYMGFSKDEAAVILESINDRGACSYADVCNNIFYHFRNNAEDFEKIFGYPMIVSNKGELNLNSSELILDLYVFANSKENGGRFFSKNHIIPSALSDKIDVFERKILNARNQVYVSHNDAVVEKFLQSKSPHLSFERDVFLWNYWGNYSYDQDAFIEALNKVERSIKDGYSPSLCYYSNGNPIRMLSYDPKVYSSTSTSVWNEGEGHIVAITGVDSDGFIVSSWGQKYKIPFYDLLNDGRFDLRVEKVVTN